MKIKTQFSTEEQVFKPINYNVNINIETKEELNAVLSLMALIANDEIMNSTLGQVGVGWFDSRLNFNPPLIKKIADELMPEDIFEKLSMSCL